MDFTCVSTREWEPIYVVMSKGLRQSQICTWQSSAGTETFLFYIQRHILSLALSLSESCLNYSRKHLLFVTVEYEVGEKEPKPHPVVESYFSEI